MEGKKYFLLILFTLSIFIVAACQRKEEKPISQERAVSNLHFIDKSVEKNAKAIQSAPSFPKIEKLEIRYCDIKNKKIYISFSKNSQELYWLPIDIDSSFKYNLTNQTDEDIIYLGKFKLHSVDELTLSFMSIYSMDESTHNYNNIFNDFYFTPEAVNLVIQKSDNFIDSTYNALIIGFYEGSGDFFEYKIYGYKNNTIKILYEPVAPIQNGSIYAINNQIYEFENLHASLLQWENQQVKVFPLRKTPLIDLQDGDAVLKYKIQDNNELIAPAKISVPISAKLILIQEGDGIDIQLNYDDQYFSQNLNQLIPKKKGSTTIMLESELGEIQKRISVIIR
ncbi:MAG TPA: hypothetical protein DCW42_03940 [Bacteroidetes bacterium]|nr:hypothetical protein [Bacteroidota bacterium]